MELSGLTSIKKIMLPQSWSARSERITQIMSIKSAYPSTHKDAEISFFKRRSALPPEDLEHFKDVLNQPPHRIADGEKELESISAVMGNAGDNQWTNRQTGYAGPCFRLINAETIAINGRRVLLVKGTFIKPENKQPINEYCGIYVNSVDDEVEELFLQVASHLGYLEFERYLKLFLDALKTIEWN